MVEGKHDILKKVNDADAKHKELKQEVYVLLEQLASLEKIINDKLIEIDSIEKEYVNLMSKLME